MRRRFGAKTSCSATRPSPIFERDAIGHVRRARLEMHLDAVEQRGKRIGLREEAQRGRPPHAPGSARSRASARRCRTLRERHERAACRRCGAAPWMPDAAKTCSALRRAASSSNSQASSVMPRWSPSAQSRTRVSRVRGIRSSSKNRHRRSLSCRIEKVAQPVAQKVQAEHGEHDGKPREDADPPRRSADRCARRPACRPSSG